MSRARTARGFTLLEVMVALAILAAAMLSASQLTSAALRNHERAVHLEVATLLARGKLAALEDQYDRSGFKDSDDSEEGTFDQDGHPEVHWKVEALKPKAELGPQQMLAMFTGGAAGNLGARSGDSSGCGCRVPTERSRGRGSLVGLFFAGMLARRRVRRR